MILDCLCGRHNDFTFGEVVTETTIEVRCAPIVSLEPRTVADLISARCVISFSFEPSADKWAFTDGVRYAAFLQMLKDWTHRPFSRASFDECRVQLQFFIDQAAEDGLLVWRLG